MENYAEVIRREFLAGDTLRDAGLKTPEDIVRYDSIQYGDDPVWNLLDVYRPKDAEGVDLPVIVNVHGGGMVYGTKETYQFYCMSLAQQGFAVVNYTYRLAPEHKFPAQLEDCCSAFRWVISHGKEYHLDLRNVFAVGDSAGGTILGQFCNLCTNLDYQAVLPTCQVPEGFVPNAVALNCGDYTYHTVDPAQEQKAEEEGSLIRSLLPYIFTQGGTAQEIRLASVTPNVTGAFPPAFVMSSQNDFLKEQFVDLTHAFVEKNVGFVSQFFVDPIEQPAHVFHCNIKSRLARFCNSEQLRFFRTYIKS